MANVGLTTERLTALDPNLPLLACRAAIELDNLIQRRNQDKGLYAVERLARILRQSVDEGKKVSFDPTTQRLMSQALDMAHLGKPKTIEDLEERAVEIATRLHSLDEKDTEWLANARDFFSVLAKSTAMHLQSIHSQSPAHKHRRFR